MPQVPAKGTAAVGISIWSVWIVACSSQKQTSRKGKDDRRPWIRSRCACSWRVVGGDFLANLMLVVTILLSKTTVAGGGGHNQKLLDRQAHRQTRRGAIESQHNNRLRSDVCSGMVSQEPSCLDASFAASVGAESSSGAGSQTWRTSQ